MQDIDFDELDRAVSSVLGTAGQQPVAAPAPVSAPVVNNPPAVPVAVTFTPAPTPAAAAPAPIVTSVTPLNHASSVHVTTTISPRSIINAPPEPAPTVSEPTLSRRNTGRFMDVVHPSSDMRASAPATSQTVSLPTPAASVPFQPIADPVPVAEPSMPTISYNSDDEEQNNAPLETPFLTDAKVEKRPLGAFSDYEEQPVSSPKPPVFEPSLEISEEALIGSKETSDTDPQALYQQEPVAVLVPETAVVEEKPVAAPAPVVTEPVRSGPPTTSSIIQQYIEQPSSDVEPSGAIFDTESYHQPLSHPQKSNSGFPAFLWIIGLILLGAGLGIALYFFVLQNL